MKYFTALSLFLLIGAITIISSCKEEDETPCVETTWYQDADGDGLGNPAISEDACEQPNGYVSNNTDTDDTGGNNTLHAAFGEFDSDNFNIYLDGDEVVIESNGLPNHTSPYWSSTTERTINGPMGAHTTPAAAEDHELFVAPTATSFDQMAPGNIDDFNGDYTLRVPISPDLATNFFSNRFRSNRYCG